MTVKEYCELFKIKEDNIQIYSEEEEDTLFTGTTTMGANCMYDEETINGMVVSEDRKSVILIVR